MANRFLDVLHSGQVLLMDGAMGTALQRQGMRDGECHELWNLTHPDRVLAIHRAYVEAGAKVLLTNTFQANPAALAKHGLADKLELICQAGVRLAREACGQDGFVLADIGPFQGSEADLCRIIETLDGVDGVLLETQSDFSLMEQFSNIKAQTSPSVLSFPLLSFTYTRNPQGRLATITSLTPEAIATRAAECGIAALGVNCGRDISVADTAEIIRRYRSVTDLPLFARPNAGTPTKVDGRWIYPRTPESMAAELPALIDAGITMLGGCCGTTPEHIAAFASVSFHARAT